MKGNIMAEEKQLETKIKSYLDSVGIPRIGASNGDGERG